MTMPAATETPGAALRRMLLILSSLVLVSLLTTFHASQLHPALDAFHEGEFFAHTWIAHLRAEGRFPVLIHGGMDHIPGRMVEAACAPDTRIVCMRVANTALVALATLLFLICCHRLASLPGARSGRLTTAALTVPGIAFVLLHNGHAVDSVGIQQGTPAVRDLVLILVLVLVVDWCRVIDEQSTLTRRALLSAPAAIGFLASLGSFWAYNRGLVTILLVVALTGAASLHRRDIRILLACALGGASGAALVVMSGIYGDHGGNIESILYWSKRPPTTAASCP